MPDTAGTRVTPKLKVLFLCTGNSGRSQMAEGWARHLKGEVIDAYSAGTHPKGLDPLAVQVMAEVGVDLSTHQVKSLDAVRYLPFDFVVTVCRDAHETCPVFPGRARIVHGGFDDPPQLTATAKSPEEALRHYVRVRGEIKAFSDLITSVALLDNKTSVLLGFRLLAPVGERQMTAQLIVRRWRVSPFDQQECSREKSPVNRPVLESSTHCVDIHIINYF
jgi:arsenate reductase (thioredoxin)